MATELTKISPRKDIYQVAYEKNLIPPMEGEVKTIFELLADKMVKEVPDADLHHAINDGVAKAHLIMGLNVKGEEAEAIQERILFVKMVAEDFKKHWSTLSLKEIDYFFELMAKGFLVDVKMITQATITQAMIRYFHKAERASAQKNWFLVQDNVLNPSVALTEEQKHQIFIDKLVERFDKFEQAYKLNNKLNLVSNGFVDYDYLDKNKIIVFDKESKDKAWKEAIEYVNNAKRDNSMPEKASSFTRMVVDLASKDKQGYTITIAKEMLLCEAYKKLISKGKNIKDLL